MQLKSYITQTEIRNRYGPMQVAGVPSPNPAVPVIATATIVQYKRKKISNLG